MIKFYTYDYFLNKQQTILKDVIQNNIKAYVAIDIDTGGFLIFNYDKEYNQDDNIDVSNLSLYNLCLSDVDEFCGFLLTCGQAIFMPTPFGIVNIVPIPK